MNKRPMHLAAVLTALLLALPATTWAGTWTIQKQNMATILMGVDFLDAETGYVAGGNDGVGPVVFRTNDGGRTWFQQVDGTPSASFLDISFGDATHGIAGGMGMFYMFAGAAYTADGKTWKASRDRWLASAYQDVEAVDARTMYLIGMWAKVYSYGEGVAASRDGGQTFHYFDWGMGTPARYGSFVSATTGYVAGGQWPYDESARYGAGAYRVNRHLTLPTVASPAAKDDTYDGYICVVAKTENGGADWTMVYEDYGNFYCNGIHFVDENNGWVVAEGDDGAYIIHTADGGMTWDEQHFEPNGSLLMVRMIDANEGWAVGASIKLGYKALFLHTVDGGETWERVDSDLTQYVMNIDAVDAEHIWAVSFGGGGCSVLKYEP